VKDAIKGYVALASGLTEVTRQRATAAAKALVAQGEATAGQVQALADDLVAQSKSNREAMVSLVRYEVDKALGRVGLVSKDEVVALQRRVKHLEGQLRDAKRGSSSAAKKAPAKKAPAKKAPAKKAVKKAAKRAPAKKAPAKAASGA
jgi:polyhydroxyalkanoate synthesis regulator phasin